MTGRSNGIHDLTWRIEKALGLRVTKLPSVGRFDNLMDVSSPTPLRNRTISRFFQGAELIVRVNLSLAKGLVWLVIFAFPRRVRKLQIQESLIFFGYCDMGSDEPLSKYWGRLPQTMRASHEFSSFDIIVDSYEIFQSAKSAAGSVYRSELITPSVWLRSLHQYLTLAFWVSLSALQFLTRHSASSNDIVKASFPRGTSAAESIVFRESLLAVDQRDTPVKAIVYLLEGQPWEQVLLEYCSNTGITSMGFLHTIVSPCQVNHSRQFGPGKVLTEPNFFLTSGPLVRNSLLDLGVKAELMLPVESLRFEWLLSLEPSAAPSDFEIVDLYTWTSPSRVLNMIDAVQKNLTNRDNRLFRLRAHPDLPFRTKKSIKRVLSALSTGQDKPNVLGTPVADAASSAWIELLVRHGLVFIWDDADSACLPISEDNASNYSLQFVKLDGLMRISPKEGSSVEFALETMFNFSEELVQWKECLRGALA